MREEEGRGKGKREEKGNKKKRLAIAGCSSYPLITIST